MLVLLISDVAFSSAADPNQTTKRKEEAGQPDQTEGRSNGGRGADRQQSDKHSKQPSNPRPGDGCSKNNNIGDYSNSFYGRWRVGGGGRKEQREMLLSFPLLLRCPSGQNPPSLPPFGACIHHRDISHSSRGGGFRQRKANLVCYYPTMFYLISHDYSQEIFVFLLIKLSNPPPQLRGLGMERQGDEEEAKKTTRLFLPASLLLHQRAMGKGG